jgi:membrane protease YdiL (CAAX protease family)
MKRIFAYSPTLSQAWLLVALCIISQLVSGWVVAEIMALITNIDLQAWTTLLSYVLSFVLMLFIVIQFGKIQPEEAPMPKTVRLSPYLFPLLLFFMPLLGFVVEPLSMWIPMPDTIKVLFEEAFQQNWPTFLTAVIAAPFAEEWLCRGVILKGLLRHYSPSKAIIWSSLLFGVLHMNPWQAIPAFCLALAMGWIYWRTQSLWPCIFMHAVNNSIAFVMLLLFPDLPSDATTMDLLGNYYALIYPCALLGCALIGYWIWKKAKCDDVVMC